MRQNSPLSCENMARGKKMFENNRNSIAEQFHHFLEEFCKPVLESS